MNNILKGLIKAIFVLSIIFSILYVASYKIWESKGFEEDIDFSEYLDKEKDVYEEVVNDKSNIGKELYKNINFKTVEENFGEQFLDIYYNNEEFTNEFFLYLAVINLEKDTLMVECNSTKEISEEKIKEKIKELFSDNVEYKNQSFKTQNESLIIEYDETRNLYTVTNNKCSGIPFKEEYIQTEFLDSKEVNDTIVVTEIAYYVSYTLEPNDSYTLNYHSNINKDSEIVGNSKNANKDKEKFQKYEYTFVKTTDNQYYLSKIAKVTA